MLYRRILPIHCEQLKRIEETHPELASVFRQGLGMCIRRSGKPFASLWPDLCHEQVSLLRVGWGRVRLCLKAIASTPCVGLVAPKGVLAFVSVFVVGALSVLCAFLSGKSCCDSGTATRVF